jgi:hypothetical protein
MRPLFDHQYRHCGVPHQMIHGRAQNEVAQIVEPRDSHHNQTSIMDDGRFGKRFGNFAFAKTDLPTVGAGPKIAP